MTSRTKPQHHYPWLASSRGRWLVRGIGQLAENLQIGDQGIEFGEHTWSTVKRPDVRSRAVSLGDPFGVRRIRRRLAVGIGTRVGDHIVGIGDADFAQRRQMRAEVVTPQSSSPKP